MKKFFPKNRRRMILFVAAAAILAAAASWTMAKTNDTGNAADRRTTADPSGTASQNLKWSKAILNVSNMSCGGCIGTIKKAVATIPGTGNVNVDLTSSTAEVMYDSGKVQNTETIAQVITDSGYPAKVQQTISSQQLSREINASSELAKMNIAKVGPIDIPRKDFEIELAHARSRYQKIYGADTFSTPQGRQLLQRIQTQIALGLVDDAVKLQEIVRMGYTVKDEKIQTAMSDYAKSKEITLDQLESNMEANGYPFTHFKKKFARRITLQNYLEEKVLSGNTDPDARQQLYGNWLANARSLAKVVYYDKEIESLVKAGSGGGCSGGGGGGGCSSGSGGGCSASR